MKIEVTDKTKFRGSNIASGTYTVLAIEIEPEATWFYIYSNPEIPVPDPCDASTVKILDNSVPGDWICDEVKFPDGSTRGIRISFKEWVNDTYFYEDAIEDNQENVALMQAKLKEYESQ